MKLNKKKKALKVVGITWCISMTLGLVIQAVDPVTDVDGKETGVQVEETKIEPVCARCDDCGEYTKVCKTDCVKCEGDEEHDHEINYWKRCGNCGKYLYDVRTREWASKVR